MDAELPIEESVWNDAFIQSKIKRVNQFEQLEWTHVYAIDPRYVGNTAATVANVDRPVSANK